MPSSSRGSDSKKSMEKQYKLELLAPAQRELDGIASLHIELVGPASARKITERIYSSLENLETLLPAL